REIRSAPASGGSEGPSRPPACVARRHRECPGSRTESREPCAADGRPEAMPDLPSRLPIGRASLALAALLVLAGCTSTNPTQPPGSPAPGSASPPASSPSFTPTSTAAPTVGAIDHPTGATDVVLRLEQGGGFAPIEMNVAEAPIFTLYGNGVIVF